MPRKCEKYRMHGQCNHDKKAPPPHHDHECRSPPHTKTKEQGSMMIALLLHSAALLLLSMIVGRCLAKPQKLGLSLLILLVRRMQIGRDRLRIIIIRPNRSWSSAASRAVLWLQEIKPLIIHTHSCWSFLGRSFGNRLKNLWFYCNSRCEREERYNPPVVHS